MIAVRSPVISAALLLTVALALTGLTPIPVIMLVYEDVSLRDVTENCFYYRVISFPETCCNKCKFLGDRQAASLNDAVDRLFTRRVAESRPRLLNNMCCFKCRAFIFLNRFVALIGHMSKLVKM